MALSKIKTNSIEDNAVSTGKIVDGTIANADVSPSAAIAQSKVNNLAPQISSLCTTATSVSADVGAVQNNIGLLGFYSMMIFLFTLTVGFIYEWKKGALEWD